MLFDLEIQPNLVDVVYIKQGNPIHNSLIPISFCNVTERNIIPSDLIEIEENSRFTAFSTAKIEMFTGTELRVASDKFLMTHVKKYSNETGTDIPLFYKHTIKFKAGASVSGDSIRVYDARGVMIGLDQFTVELDSNTLLLYMNPRKDEILIVEYTIDDGLKRELIKLEPIFTQVEWDWITTKQDLKMFEYLVMPITYENEVPQTTVFTKYSNYKYFVYQKNVSIFKKPIASMNESWYLRLENIEFIETVGGETLKYFMPEFNLQQLNYNMTFKRYVNIAAKIIGNKYVQLQDSVQREYLDSVNIYIKNTQLDKLEFLFTLDQKKINTRDDITGLRWMVISDWNTDGIFELPVVLTSDHIATSDFMTPNKYYELRTLDINSLDINSTKILGIYMVNPGLIDNLTMTVFYGYIGVYDTARSYEKITVNGSGFRDKEEYRAILEENYCVHLAYVALSSSKMIDITEFYDARDFNGGIINRKDLAAGDYDIFIDDLSNGNIILPTSDTVVATIDENIFAKARNSKDNLTLIKEKNTKYIDFVRETLSKNLDVSTDIIINN